MQHRLLTQTPDTHDVLVSLKPPAQLPLAHLLERLGRPVTGALRLNELNSLYARLSVQTNWRDFILAALEDLEVSYQLPQADLQNIPKDGPLLVVANHPFGAIEGLILGLIISQVRPDVKIMVNSLLERVAGLRELFLFVNPFGGDKAAGQNLTAMRQCYQHLAGGGTLGVFPAGEVASLNLRKRRIIDPPWSPHVVRFVRKTKATVLPVFFSGHNSLLFQMAGLLHPRIRTAMLAREMFNLRGTRIDVRIGSIIPASKVERFATDQEAVEHLRCRTYALSCRDAEPQRVKPVVKPQTAIIAPVRPILLEAEINSLSDQNLLVDNGDMASYLASAHDIPHILREIGRLREVTFRATGEGTGRELDLDPFDNTYQHLFVWHRKDRQLVGAYRVGYADQIMAKQGIRGLYTHSLFQLNPQLLKQLGPTLELGRSFVREEYQRTFSPLLMLWKGIGQLVVRKPEYACLLGPVSISNTYQTFSRQLMVEFLNRHHGLSNLTKMVRARNPFRQSRHSRIMRSQLASLPTDAESISDLITDLEDDGKGMPILIRQYLKLGARVLSFNVDPDFSDVLDALIMVDLRHTDTKLLDRYMTRDGRRSFHQHHGIPA